MGQKNYVNINLFKKKTDFHVNPTALGKIFPSLSFTLEKKS